MKEEFCGTCVAGLTALAGGISTASSTAIEDKEKKKWVFWISLSITIISILVLIYLLYFKSDCKSCSSSS